MTLDEFKQLQTGDIIRITTDEKVQVTGNASTKRGEELTVQFPTEDGDLWIGYISYGHEVEHIALSVTDALVIHQQLAQILAI